MSVRKIKVEPWTPEYASSHESQPQTPSDAAVDVDVELPAAAWRPLDPRPEIAPASRVHVVDGVRRIDARVWITGGDGLTRMGICASYAAGVVLCQRDEARITLVEVRRGLFAPAGAAPDDDAPLVTRAGAYPFLTVAGDDPEQLSLGLQQRMGELEVAVAGRALVDAGHESHAEADSSGGPDLILVDGPLNGRQNVTGAIGYVKTHRVAYLPPALGGVVPRLRPGQRSPLFLTQTSWSRFSWYLRLPGGEGHPWAGIVRCEASADLPPAAARTLADRSALTLPRFASVAHKDPRAPQNLYPIGGLERELRHRLGDPAHVERALRTAVSGR
ncbi:MAG: hypothetical protein M3133_00915 [Actinomycetota bacterium]|nr:hypothetical protein [Actinomycetota bacterium]